MIEAAHLINMKCFKDLKIDFRPLSVLTGFNAAGKSTALQSVLLLSQATHTLCVEGVIPLNGEYARLGSPGEVIGDFGSKSMSIELKSEGERCRWSLQAVTGAQERLEIVEVNGSKGEVAFAPQPNRLWPNELKNGALWNALKKVHYISAVRRGPNDIYLVPDDIDLERGNVGVEGQFASWWYARCVDDEIPVERLHPHEAASSLRKQLDAYMSEIFPGSGANAEHVAKGSATRLEMRTSISSGWHRPSNVGYGLSYLFPIFVALLLATKGSTLIIDSPEAHLHPSAQSKLGQILARFAHCGVQIVVESHSDHLLNGIRLGVKNGVIYSDNVTVLFFSGASEASHGVTSLRVDNEGSLDAWPVGFFDQAEIDMASLTGWDQ